LIGLWWDIYSNSFIVLKIISVDGDWEGRSEGEVRERCEEGNDMELLRLYTGVDTLLMWQHKLGDVNKYIGTVIDGSITHPAYDEDILSQHPQLMLPLKEVSTPW